MKGADDLYTGILKNKVKIIECIITLKNQEDQILWFKLGELVVEVSTVLCYSFI